MNPKGGVGKTTTAMNLIHFLNPDFIVDCDAHKSISTLLEYGPHTTPVKVFTNRDEFYDLPKNKMVLIDCGGFDSTFTRTAMKVADVLITPTTDDPTDQLALMNLNSILASVSEEARKEIKTYAFLNGVHHSRSLFPDFDSLLEGLPYINKLPVVIPRSATMAKNMFKGQGVVNGPVAALYCKLAKLIQEVK